MAHGRMLDKRLSQSKKLGLVSDKARTLYFMIYPHLDREGRIAFDDLEDLKEEIIPRFKDWNLKKIATSLNELADIGLIQLYPNSHRIAMEFYKFNEFQIGLRRDREAESKISPPQKDDENCRILPLSYNLSSSLEEDKLSKVKLSVHTTPQSSAIIDFNFEKKAWIGIADEDIKFFKDTYPAVNIETELKKMAAWLLANPEKRKKNYRRFITNWLNRTQDSGGTKQSISSTKEWVEKMKKEGLDESI
jgi:hypothetical protein